MKILIFGGTTEGRELTAALSKLGHDVTASVARDIGAEELEGIDCKILQGGMDLNAMKWAVKFYDLIVDATHPYAVAVSADIRAACEVCGVELVRILRAGTDTAGCVHVASCADAADYLMDKEGNVLLTTGAKELSVFMPLGSDRVYARVLPTLASITACEQAGVSHKNIIAMHGPFPAHMNEAMLEMFNIAWVVTKDGGKAGGVEEKLSAARKCGAKVVVVSRTEESGITPEELIGRLS